MGRIIKKYRFLLSGKQQRHVVILFIMMILGAFLEVLGISMMIPLISAILNKNIIEEPIPSSANDIIEKILVNKPLTPK